MKLLMKTFDEMFKDKITPDSIYLIWVDGDEVRMGEYPGSCDTCGNTTQFYSISFWGRYCSPKCLKAEWDRYSASCAIKEAIEGSVQGEKQHVIDFKEKL